MQVEYPSLSYLTYPLFSQSSYPHVYVLSAATLRVLNVHIPTQIKIKATEFRKSFPFLLKEKSWRLSKRKFNKGVFKLACKDVFDTITAHI